MKILVTGASGFIGRNFIRLALAQGHEVRAIHRRPRLDSELEDLALQYKDKLGFCRMDLAFPRSMPDLSSTDFKEWKSMARTGIPSSSPDWPVAPEDLEQAKELLDGCQAVVHIAALAFDWGKDEVFFAANVNPLHVLTAAALQFSPAPSFLLISSMAVHGFGPHVRSTEAGPYYRATNPYQTSKRMAESLLAAKRRSGLACGVIRPGNVYGPGDTTTFYPIFEALEKGIMGTLGGGKKLTCPVHVEDLCSAMAKAMVHVSATAPGKAGLPVWDISHTDRITWKEVLDCCHHRLGLKGKYPNLPGFLAWTAATVLEGLFRAFRIKAAPPLTFYRIRQLLNDYDFSPLRAATDLDWVPAIPFATGMESSVDAWKKSRKSNESS